MQIHFQRMVYKNIKKLTKRWNALLLPTCIYLGHVANPYRVLGFGGVSNPSPRHDSLFLRGSRDRNIVEICDTVNTPTCTKLHMGNSLFHYIL